jgi:hypothetical protein
VAGIVVVLNRKAGIAVVVLDVLIPLLTSLCLSRPMQRGDLAIQRGSLQQINYVLLQYLQSSVIPA